MADNVSITAGAGTPIATDDIGGVHYQIVKQAFGALDAVTLVSAANPYPITGTVTANAGAGTFAVSGPITDAQLRAAAVPVSLASTAVTGSVAVTGTFWQVTQPVSGTVTANAGTGTFAVSGPLTDTQLRASAVPISAAALPLPSGAATEATLAALNTKTPALGQVVMASSSPVTIASNQSAVPISGTVTANAGTGVADVTASGSLAALNATVALALGGGYSGAVVQITGTWVGTIQFEGTAEGANWLPINGVFAGSSAPGPTVTANGIIRLTPAGLAQIRVNMTAFTSGSAVITLRASQGSGGTFLNQSLTVGANIIGKVGIDQTTPGTTNLVSATGPTLTKATQGATGYSVQNLKDAGRTLFSAATVIAGVTAVTVEALVTMVPTRAGVVSATVTSQSVTSGKRLRLTGINIGFISTAAAVLSMRFALRTNPAGAVTATSPILRILAVPSGAALAQAGGFMDIEIPDGIEFSGTEQFGITQIGSVATGTIWVSMTGFEY